MWKILIADDEELERRAIKSIIQRKYGNEVSIYEAKNGREAIETSDRERPDIVIMDIKMPGINGIEAIKEIQKHLKETYIIILTAYDYFEFAKEAIEYNVREYILKPLNREKFIEKLNKALKEIEEKNLDKVKRLELKEKLYYMLPILENELCQSIVNNTLSNIDYCTYLQYLNMNFKSGYCILIKINEKYLYVNLSEEEKLKIKREVNEYLKEIINRFYKSLVSWNFTHNNLVAFIENVEGEEDYNIRLEAINLGRKLRRDIKEKYNISLSIGIGRRYKGIEEFNKSYGEAYMSLKYHIKDVNVKHFQDICAIIGEEYIKDAGNNDKNYLEVKEIEEAINDLYDSNKEGQKSILLKSINYIKSNYNKDITLEKISDKFNLSPYYYSRIFKEFTGKNYSEYITYIRIESAKRMLQENLLSVKEIGFKIGYNDPNYFSRVFKKVLGISPTEYKSKLN